MIEINGERIIGVVFGVGVFYALCQIFTGLGKQHDGRGISIDLGILLRLGVLLVVALAYVVGTKYLSKELASSGTVARVFWVLFMTLPTALYVVIFCNPNLQEKGKKNQRLKTGENNQEPD